MAEEAVCVTDNCPVTLNKQTGCSAGWIYIQEPQSSKKVLCALTHEADFKENGHFLNPIFLPFSTSFDEDT